MPRGVGDKFVDIGSTRCQHLPGAGTAGRAVPVGPVATGLVGGWRLVNPSQATLVLAQSLTTLS